MIHREKERGKLFPMYIKIDQKAQMKEAGLVYQTSIFVDDEPICEECEKLGKADFECAICEKRHTTDKIEESIGYPPEFLCKNCYETVSAKEWNEKYDELLKDHRYDFE